ncbi:MAG: acyl-CoA thioesterase [Bacteroidetes bacterium]|nr:MAG: acyl-CoA thioesterase [Bacteroidota bacterium]
MMELTIEIKIRYDEVDKMGYVYHGNYAKFFHLSRTELLRTVGLCDKSLEEHDILLPVIEMNIRYLKPVFYDDIIKVSTRLLKTSFTKMFFEHNVYNANNELINKGTSTLALVDLDSRKPIRMPEFIKMKLTASPSPES